MKNIIIKITNTIKENREKEIKCQEIIARRKARLAREAYFTKQLEERAERLSIENQRAKELFHLELQKIYDRKNSKQA